MTEANPMMQCAYPPPLTEDQLSDVIDGIANPEVHAHLSSCAFCAARLEEARQVEWALSRQLYHWDAPSIDELADYVMDLLDDAARKQIDAYLKISPSARAEVENLRNFLKVGVSKPARPRPEPRLRIPSLEEIIAAILPRTMQPALRGDGGIARGELTAQGRGVTIFIEYVVDGNLCTLTGQVMASEPDAWSGALAQILAQGKLLASAHLEGAGEFKFAGIPPGTYDLRIASEHHQVIVVHELKIDL